MIVFLILIAGFILSHMSMKLGCDLGFLIDNMMALKFWKQRYFKKALLGGFSDLYLKQLGGWLRAKQYHQNGL